VNESDLLVLDWNCPGIDLPEHGEIRTRLAGIATREAMFGVALVELPGSASSSP